MDNSHQDADVLQAGAVQDVDVADAVRSLGGVVDRAHLLRFVTRAQLDRAVVRGQVEVVRRGRLTTPDHDRALAAAATVGGVLCLQSAALARGWSVAERPRRIQVTVPRNRSVATHLGQGLELYRRDVTTEGAVTSAEQTVLDCATYLPLLEAVSVGDSALRSGQVGPESLRRAAETSARSGRSRRLVVVSLLDGRAANPFESAVRVLASKVVGLDLVPQLHLPGYGWPDLRDPRRRVIVECDSFTHHHDRVALVHDTERYNTAAILGQAMLRFAFEHPFRRPDYVEHVLQS